MNLAKLGVKTRNPLRKNDWISSSVWQARADCWFGEDMGPPNCLASSWGNTCCFPKVGLGVLLVSVNGQAQTGYELRPGLSGGACALASDLEHGCLAALACVRCFCFVFFGRGCCLKINRPNKNMTCPLATKDLVCVNPLGMVYNCQDGLLSAALYANQGHQLKNEVSKGSPKDVGNLNRQDKIGPLPWKATGCWDSMLIRRVLGVPSMSIPRDPNLSRKPLDTLGTWPVFGKNDG